MNSHNTENLWTLFGNDALSNPFPYVQNLFDCITNKNIETVLYHAPFELPQLSLFQSDAAGLGRFAYLPTGERLFVRVRSYFGNSEVRGRALLPIEFGERREITLVVTSISNPLKVGSLKVVIANWLTNEPPDPTRGAPPRAVRSPSQAAYGISIAPFVLLDSFAGKNKKPVSIGGYEVLWAGSSTIIESFDTLRDCALRTSVQRGISNNYLAEWVAAVSKRSKVDLSIIFECGVSTLEQVVTKTVTKIGRTIEARNAHPTRNELAETIADVPSALRLANYFFEHGTLLAMVDMLARDTFKGVGLSVFNVPTKFPLYMTTCIFLSAFPEIARLPNTGASHAEDSSNAAALIELYRSSTAGTDRATGQRSSAFEAVLAVACDGAGAFTERKLSCNSKDGSVKSVYVRADGSGKSEEHASHVPYAIESMRRQGAALVQELFGHFTRETQAWDGKNKASYLGKETFATALNTTSGRLARIAISDRRKASGSTGSAAQAWARSVRISTRAAMQRVVLEIMIELNRFLTDGTFRMCRYAAENTPEEEAVSGIATGIARNANACRVVHSDLVTYFTSGVSALITDGIPRVFPIRPNTRVRCGDCGERFDPLCVTTRDNLAVCEECNVLFCLGCYSIRVKNMIAANGGDPITLQTMNEHPHLMRCVRCVRFDKGRHDFFEYAQGVSQ